MGDELMFILTSFVTLSVMGSFGLWIGRHHFNVKHMLFWAMLGLEILLVTVFIGLVARAFGGDQFVWFHWLVLFASTVASVMFHGLLIGEHFASREVRKTVNTLRAKIGEDRDHQAEA